VGRYCDLLLGAEGITADNYIMPAGAVAMSKPPEMLNG